MAGEKQSWSLETEDKQTSVREELTKEVPLKDGEKNCESPQPPGKTKTELLLKFQHQDWLLEEYHQNY
jgi:hypothetical protein